MEAEAAKQAEEERRGRWLRTNKTVRRGTGVWLANMHNSICVVRLSLHLHVMFYWYQWP